MVQAKDTEKTSSKLWEAKTFLIIRSLQRAHQRAGKKSDINVYRNAIQKEFELKKIKFRLNTSGQAKGVADFHCFNYLAIFIFKTHNLSSQDVAILEKYLKKSKLSTALLIFQDTKGLDIKRLTI